jgi:3-mercaptopyruvate sulfurtransferase SseA
VVRELQRAEWKKARALTGGWDAWQAAGLPIEPKASQTEEETMSDEG